jgi:hypothetical protein
MARSDSLTWAAEWRVDRYTGDVETLPGVDGEAKSLESGLLVPSYDTTERKGNLLVIGGASALWQRLIGTAITAFDNTNAYISVGDSATAAADTQTELQAATNRVRKAMDATYPLHTDTTGTVGSKTITFRSTYATGDANFAWNEWGIFNAAGTGGPPTTGGRMLNRKVESLGTKTSAATWVLTVSISLA